jgi:hypothetical protein
MTRILGTRASGIISLQKLFANAATLQVAVVSMPTNFDSLSKAATAAHPSCLFYKSVYNVSTHRHTYFRTTRSCFISDLMPLYFGKAAWSTYSDPFTTFTTSPNNPFAFT